jgi:hypothetical protein
VGIDHLVVTPSTLVAKALSKAKSGSQPA